jgi:hypothetical protein
MHLEPVSHCEVQDSANAEASFDEGVGEPRALCFTGCLLRQLKLATLYLSGIAQKIGQ